MKTIEELRSAFAVYYLELDRCERAGAYWAVLHIALVLPDICAALESGPDALVGSRYVRWCSEHFPNRPTLTPVDRYQIRNAILHEGSTLPNKSQYSSVSFVEPGSINYEVHLNVSGEEKASLNLTIDVKSFADETRAAMTHWFKSLQTDPKRNAAVSTRLVRVARVQVKESLIQIATSDGDNLTTSDGHIINVAFRHNTTSST